jgi:hypothetical protein
MTPVNGHILYLLKHVLKMTDKIEIFTGFNKLHYLNEVMLGRLKSY